MKILMVNKFHYIKGGSETYYFALKRKLQDEGHIVIDFSMKDDKNFYSPYSEYFVENVNYENSDGVIEKVKMAGKIIYSFEAKKKFETLVQKEKPDLVHLHIFQHQISPSILDVIKKYGIPTVYTAHDLKQLCPNYKMMHHGMICEECKGARYYQCVKNRCVKESFAKSCISVVEGYFHKWRKSYNAISMIITPSLFYKKKFEEFGIQAEKVIYIPNFLDKEKPIVNVRGDSKQYYLYFGRLSEEKGLLTLVKAAEKTSINLYIVGTGPMKSIVEHYIEEQSLNNVRLFGFKDGQELIDLVGNAKAIIIPSEWYENGPYSAIEALQMGRPVIGANIGGIPELIERNGILFESGNAESLKEAIQEFENLSEKQYKMMEEASFNMFRDNYTWERHFDKLKKVYLQVLNH